MAEAVKGLNIKLGLDAGPLNDKLKKIKDNLKDQQATLRAINRNLKFDPSNVDLLKQKQEVLTKAISLANEKLDAGKAKLADAKKELEVGAIGEREFNRISNAVTNTSADLSNFQNQMAQAKKKAEELANEKWDNLGKIGRNLNRHITLPIVGVITSLKALSVASLHTIGTLGNQAKKINMSVEAYQEFAYIADILSIDQGKLNKAFGDLNKTLGNVANGNIDEVNEKLACVGLTAKDLEGLNTEQAFMKIRNAINSLETASQRAAAASTIFGNQAGPELTQLLNLSNAELTKYQNELKELGVINAEETKMAQEFNNEIKRLKVSFRKIQFEIAKIFLPCLHAIVDIIKNYLVPAIHSLINWWNKLSSVDKSLIVTFGLVASSIGPIFMKVSALVPQMKSLHKAFTETAGSVMILGKAVKLSTIGIWAGVAAIGVLLLQNEKFRSLLKNIIDGVASVLSKIIDGVVDLISSLMPLFEKLMGGINKILDVLVVALGKVVNPIIKFVDFVADAVVKLLPVITEVVEAIVNTLLPVIDVIAIVLKPISSIIIELVGFISDVISVVSELIDSCLGSLIGVVKLIGNSLNSLISIISIVIKSIGKLLVPILRTLEKALSPIKKMVDANIKIFRKFYDTIGKIVNKLLEPFIFLLFKVGEIINFIAPLIGEIGEMLEQILTPALEAIFAILEPFIDIINGVVDALLWLFNVFTDVLLGGGKYLNEFGEKFEGTFIGKILKVIKIFSTFFAFIRLGIKNLINGLIDFGENVVNFLKNILKGFINWISSLFDRVANFFKDIWNKIKDLFDGDNKSKKRILKTGNDINSSREKMSSQTNNYNNRTKNVVNNVTINTTSPTFDIESINRELGGDYF